VSGGGNPFYKVAQQDSRNLADFFNKVGFQKGEDEAKYNVKNPGHAISTAAEYALAGYLGSLMAGGEAGAGAAGNAAAPVVDESAGLLMSAGSNAATLAEQQAAEQALQQALQQAPQGLANTMEAGLTDTGYTPSSLLNAFKNPGATAVSAANRALGTSASQTGLLGKLTVGSGTDKAAKGLLNGGGGKGSNMAQQMGMRMLFDQQQPQMPQSPPPRQGPVEPLPRPYNQGPYGTSSGNSMGMPSMDEEMKKKLRAMGYPV
jgi:hypothetical protein